MNASADWTETRPPPPGLVLTLAAVLGALVSLGRTGNPGVWGEFCVIAGVAYSLSLWVMHRRR